MPFATNAVDKGKKLKNIALEEMNVADARIIAVFLEILPEGSGLFYVLYMSLS